MEKTEGSVRQIENPDRPANLTRELRSLLGRSAESDGRSDAPLVETMGVRGSRGLKGEEEEEDARAMFRDMKEEADALEREKRECPVPKPRGKIGELLGFGRDGRRLRDEDAR